MESGGGLALGTTTITVNKLGFALPLSVPYSSDVQVLSRATVPTGVPSCPTPGGGGNGGSAQLEFWFKHLLGVLLPTWLNTAAKCDHSGETTVTGIAGKFEELFIAKLVTRVKLDLTVSLDAYYRWGNSPKFGNFGKLWFRGPYGCTPAQFVSNPKYSAYPPKLGFDRVGGWLPEGVTGTMTAYHRSRDDYAVTDAGSKVVNIERNIVTALHTVAASEYLPTAFLQGPFIKPVVDSSSSYVDAAGYSGADYHAFIGPGSIGTTEALVMALLNECWQATKQGWMTRTDDTRFDQEGQLVIDHGPQYIDWVGLSLSSASPGYATTYGKSGLRYYGVAVPEIYDGFFGDVIFLSQENQVMDFTGQSVVAVHLILFPGVKVTTTCSYGATRYHSIEVATGPVNMAAGDTTALFLL